VPQRREEMVSDKYILEGRNAVACSDLMEWGKWMETGNRHVAQDTVGDIRISTVFLGLDHSFGGSRPMLFETMIFGGPHDGYQDRCSTWDDAEKIHSEAVAMARSGLN
jgi:hypothetical protein